MAHAFGLNVPQTLEEACDPARAALLVYDMQVGIMRQLPDAAQITSPVGQVLQAAREGGFRVFFTRHLSLPKTLMGVFQLRQAMAWQRTDSVEKVTPWFLRDTPPFELIPEMTPLASEAIFDKITMSAFEGAPLNIALRDCGIDTLVIIGVAMEVGIEPTARHAADLGYIPVIVTDACGSHDKEAAQRALDGLKFTGDAWMTDAETICRLFRQTRNDS